MHAGKLHAPALIDHFFLQIFKQTLQRAYRFAHAKLCKNKKQPYSSENLAYTGYIYSVRKKADATTIIQKTV